MPESVAPLLLFCICLLTILVIFQYFRIRLIQRNQHKLQGYVADACIRHNKLCIELALLAQLMADKEEDFTDHKKCHLNLVFAHNALVKRVNHVYNSWQNEWQSGESWKSGYEDEEPEEEIEE